MSPTLTDAGMAASDPSDGLAVLEQRGSKAETFGIPLAVLAELTHRCPLQCPYCSNPVELERGSSGRLASLTLMLRLRGAVIASPLSVLGHKRTRRHMAIDIGMI